jgi:hypothetical protein
MTDAEHLHDLWPVSDDEGRPTGDHTCVGEGCSFYITPADLKAAERLARLAARLAPVVALRERLGVEPLAWELHAENEWSIGVVLAKPIDGQGAGDGYLTGLIEDGEGDIAMSIAHNGIDSRGAEWPALIVVAVNLIEPLAALLAEGTEDAAPPLMPQGTFTTTAKPGELPPPEWDDAPPDGTPRRENA